MKNSIVIAFSFFALMCFSCSSDDTEASPTEPLPTITSFTHSLIGPNSTEPFDFTNYILENNRIVSSTRFAESFNIGVDDVMTNDTYTYEEDKILEINTYESGNIIRTINYIYNNNGQLSEYINKFNNIYTQQSFYDRHTFEYNQDTIYVERKKSTDGINYDTPVSDIKMVLDSNDNRIYFQTFDYINIDEFIEIKKNTYDLNNNMISQETSSIYPDGSEFFANQQSYTYITDRTNTLQFIYNQTFGKKNTMLLYHIELEILNNLNPKVLSPNVMESFEISPSFSGFTTEINTIVNDEGYSLLDEYTSYSNGNFASAFSIEYIFE